MANFYNDFFTNLLKRAHAGPFGATPAAPASPAAPGSGMLGGAGMSGGLPPSQFGGGGAIGPMNPAAPDGGSMPPLPVPINRGYGGAPFASGGAGGRYPMRPNGRMFSTL
jgi:hypothetical protein